MSVKKRGMYYWMQFMVDGRRIRKSTKCTSRRDAEEVERAYRTQLAKSEVGFKAKKRVPCFKEAVAEFLKWNHQEHSTKRNTSRRAETASKALLAFFGDRSIDQISIEDVERFKSWRKNQKKQAPNRKLKKNSTATSTSVIKPATVNRELATLRVLLNFFIRNDVIIKNPVSRVKFLKDGNEHTRVVSRDEERLYLMACSQPLQDLATIMIETGMRPSEVCALQWKDVNIEKGFVFIQEGKTKAARRKIPLSTKATIIFESRLNKRDGDFVFPAMRGLKNNRHIIKLNNAHNAAIERAKLPFFRIYDLRHTFATRATEAGVDLLTLAALLGHSRVQMVMRYAHPTEQHQFEAIRKIENSQIINVQSLETSIVERIM
jgi:integrase